MKIIKTNVIGYHFFDFDEFLEVRPKANSIQEFLGNPRYNKCENIKINFLLYNDNNLLYYDNRSVKERFPIPVYSHWSNNIVKSTVKGGLEHNYWKKKMFGSYFIYECYKL